MPQNNPDLKIETPEKQAVAGKPMRRGWILTAMVMTMILAAMDNTIESTATPQIVGDLGGFSLLAGYSLSVYSELRLPILSLH